MAPARRTVWVLLALSGVLNLRSCWTFTCPSICTCSLKSDTCYKDTRDKLSCTRETQLRSQWVLLSVLTKLYFFTYVLCIVFLWCGFYVIPWASNLHIVYLFKICFHLYCCLSLIFFGANKLNLKPKPSPLYSYLLLFSPILFSYFLSPSLLSSSLIFSPILFSDFLSPLFSYFSSLLSSALLSSALFYTILCSPLLFSPILCSPLLSSVCSELGDNMQLHSIPANAFQGITEETKLQTAILDVSSTALDTLPRRGLEHLKVLIARSTPYLKTLPPLESLLELEVAEITYTSHCCAFHTWRRKDKDHSVDNMTDLYDINLQYPDLQLSLCPGPFQCTPESDAFNPCEDLLGYSFLRSVTWLITVFAVAGNMAVLVVLIISHQKLNVSRFLMCNLAFADLCTGVYLLLIAAMDFHSRKEYYNHATFWQTGAGCGVAGFLTVFASELSVYTLTIITLERWHTITNAMHKNKRLRLRHVVAMMAGGWAFSLLAALLPVLGVSSYTKVSICLPMDIESLASQVYVVALLLLNVTAFFIICCCYIRIYMSIHNPDLAIRHGDSKIAKRMAVLIFTDFICMAPISFFGISAALRMPLITVSHSKILLVLFYPINSLCNPFLYTIFTRSFQKDIRLLLSRCSFCLARVEFYRAQNLEAHTIPPKGSTTSPRKHHSFRFYTYHIKMQRCFLCEGGGAT
uniref:G-protein coupled receptors family 1 profile domain-containing protein n=1 Tax=Oncorhynchus tshawytscha TaxID=74940 RepID=A0AAZ3SX68_ONCTS